MRTPFGMCRRCGLPIRKGDWYFAWYWALRRWHPSCLMVYQKWQQSSDG